MYLGVILSLAFVVKVFHFIDSGDELHGDSTTSADSATLSIRQIHSLTNHALGLNFSIEYYFFFSFFFCKKKNIILLFFHSFLFVILIS